MLQVKRFFNVIVVALILTWQVGMLYLLALHQGKRSKMSDLMFKHWNFTFFLM